MLEGLAPQKLALLKTLNAFLETRVSPTQFKTALVATYIKGRRDAAEGAGLTVTAHYLLHACRRWILENAIQRQQFESALLTLGYTPKGLEKKSYRNLAKTIWPSL